VRNIPFALIDLDTQQAIAAGLVAYMLLRGVRAERSTVMAALQALNPGITWDVTNRLR